MPYCHQTSDYSFRVRGILIILPQKHILSLLFRMTIGKPLMLNYLWFSRGTFDPSLKQPFFVLTKHLLKSGSMPSYYTQMILNVSMVSILNLQILFPLNIKPI